MTSYQLWNDETRNLIDEFDTEAEALDEVRWRFAVGGEVAANRLSLLRFIAPDASEAIAIGDELLQRARAVAHATAADD